MRKKNKHAPDAIPLGDILKVVLKPDRSDGNFDLARIWQVWDRTVGPVIAENVRPAGFKGKTLLVYASSSPWLQQLQFLKEDTIQKLNEDAGEQLVTDIKFKVGTW